MCLENETHSCETGFCRIRKTAKKIRRRASEREEIHADCNHGSTGFIGRYIVKHLTDLGHATRCWHRATSDRSWALMWLVFGIPTNLVTWVSGQLDDAASSTAWSPGAMRSFMWLSTGRETVFAVRKATWLSSFVRMCSEPCV